MQLIPLLHLKNRKITPPSHNKHHHAETLLQSLDDEQLIYLYDHDGIDQNKPNLCLYKTLSEQYVTWVDNGPRALGDIVDTVMTGSQHLTLRKKFWPTFTLFSIKEITDNHIYLYHNPQYKTQDSHDTSLPHLGDGIVLFNKDNTLLSNFSLTSTIKPIITKFPSYLYDPDPKNYSYWKNLGIHGLLIDLNYYQEFKNNGH